jgi:nitrite reductase (NADH) small subunit
MMMETVWIDVGSVYDVPRRGSRVIATPGGDIAVFRSHDERIFALWDRCPHKGGPLSQGIVHGHSVTCPLHNWVIGLETGEVKGPDQGCARKVAARVEQGRILLAAEALGQRAA